MALNPQGAVPIGRNTRLPKTPPPPEMATPELQERLLAVKGLSSQNAEKLLNLSRQHGMVMSQGSAAEMRLNAVLDVLSDAIGEPGSAAVQKFRLDIEASFENRLTAALAEMEKAAVRSTLAAGGQLTPEQMSVYARTSGLVPE